MRPVNTSKAKGNQRLVKTTAILWCSSRVCEVYSINCW
jgi:hypothetical protein